MKKFLQLRVLLTLAILSTVISAYAFDFESGGFYFNVLSEQDKTVEVTSGDTPYSGNIEIPRQATNNGITYTVTIVGDHAFAECSSLTSVIIPNSVLEIGRGAFSECEAMTSVSIPNSVTGIEEYAFMYCSSLETIDIPNSVITIGTDAFSECHAVSSITIGNSVASIGDYAFSRNYNLTSITIPASVSHIGSSVFGECSNLETIDVDVKNNNYSSVECVLYNKDVTTLISCPGAKSEVIIPKSVITIGASAFAECGKLTSVTIPNSVKNIEISAFEACSGLTSLDLPNSIINISDFAFNSCSGLTSLSIPNSVISIGAYVFCNSHNLTTISIPASVSTIGESSFANCEKLKSIDVDPNNENFSSSEGVMYNKDMTTLIACPGAKSNISFPISVTTIGDYAFSSCRLLKSLMIPNTVKTIGESAFTDCIGLESVIIPQSVTTIKDGAFYGCDAISAVYNRNNTPVEGKPEIFSDITFSNATLFIPNGTLGRYESVDPWRFFANIVETDFSGVEEVGSDMSDVRVSVKNGVLTVNGIAAGNAFVIYDMCGRAVYSGNDTVVSALPSGFYILKAGNKAVKFAI